MASVSPGVPATVAATRPPGPPQGVPPPWAPRASTWTELTPEGTVQEVVPGVEKLTDVGDDAAAGGARMAAARAALNTNRAARTLTKTPVLVPRHHRVATPMVLPPLLA